MNNKKPELLLNISKKKEKEFKKIFKNKNKRSSSRLQEVITIKNMKLKSLQTKLMKSLEKPMMPMNRKSKTKNYKDKSIRNGTKNIKNF